MVNPSDRASKYQRLKRGLVIVETGFTLAYLLILLISGWTFHLRDLAVYLGGRAMGGVLVYFGVAVITLLLLLWPVNVWFGYVLEKQYGLLQQTAREWAWDLIKVQLAGLFLGILAVAVLYSYLILLPEWWWLPAAGAWAIFYVALVHLFPVIILPWFYKFRKLPDNKLTRRLLAWCARSGTEIMGIYGWSQSTNPRKAEALLVGWGPTRRVVLSDYLLSAFNASEVEVMLAHELGHHRLGHLWTRLAWQIGITGLGFFIAHLLFEVIGPGIGLGYLADPAGMPLLSLIFFLMALLGSPWHKWLLRRQETQADYYALKLTGLAGSFISTMERLAVLNLTEMNPSPVVEFLFNTQPSPARRIKAAKEFRKKIKRINAVR